MLCNACGARYLVKRSLDGYMPGQKPSKLAAASPAAFTPASSEPRPVARTDKESSRKRRVVDRCVGVLACMLCSNQPWSLAVAALFTAPANSVPHPRHGTHQAPRCARRYELEDLYHFKRAQQRTQRPPVSINVTAGLSGFMETSISFPALSSHPHSSISLWKPSEPCAGLSRTRVESCAGEASSLDSLLTYASTNSLLKVCYAVVFCTSLVCMGRCLTPLHCCHDSRWIQTRWCWQMHSPCSSAAVLSARSPCAQMTCRGVAGSKLTRQLGLRHSSRTGAFVPLCVLYHTVFMATALFFYVCKWDACHCLHY
jgi:hypothetical protein